LKTRILVALALFAVMGAAFASVAGAGATTKTSRGTLHSFKSIAPNTWQLKTINRAKVKRYYRVHGETDCGVVRGQSGDQIPCKTLGKSKYAKKPVRVMWETIEGKKYATQVAVTIR